VKKKSEKKMSWAQALHFPSSSLSLCLSIVSYKSNCSNSDIWWIFFPRLMRSSLSLSLFLFVRARLCCCCSSCFVVYDIKRIFVVRMFISLFACYCRTRILIIFFIFIFSLLFLFLLYYFYFLFMRIILINKINIMN
jgi:hypothetical protein